MGILVVVYAIAAIRTNIAFFLIFLTLIPTCKLTPSFPSTYANCCTIVGCLAGAFFTLAKGDVAAATTYQHVGAGLLLAATLIGWYIFLALVLLAVDFPILVPLGDLSTKIPGYSERQQKKNN